MRWLSAEGLLVASALPGETDSMSEAGPEFAKDLMIPSDPAEARQLQEEVERQLKAQRFSEREIFSIKLALEEALVNAIKHGNRLDPSKKVHIAYTIRPDRFDVRITDEGPGFDPNDVPDPTALENLERPCGRGLMLMRYYMTHVSFNATGNSVVMTKLRNGNQ